MVKNKKKRLVALTVALLMAFSFAIPVSANTQLDPPEVIQSSGVGIPAGFSPLSRMISWEAVDGAVSFDLYVFTTLADAQAGENAAAVVNITPDEDGNVEVDFRQLIFEELNDSGVIYDDEIVNDEDFVRAMHTTGNLMPGAYWVRVRSIAADDAYNSELSALALNRQHAELEPEYLPITIAIGPSEARQLIEVRFDDIGSSLRLIDLRPDGGNHEILREGWIRFVDERIINIHTAFNPAVQDEMVLELLDDFDATILIL